MPFSLLSPHASLSGGSIRSRSGGDTQTAFEAPVVSEAPAVPVADCLSHAVPAPAGTDDEAPLAPAVRVTPADAASSGQVPALFSRPGLPSRVSVEDVLARRAAVATPVVERAALDLLSTPSLRLLEVDGPLSRP
jgi:hypothetical protein